MLETIQRFFESRIAPAVADGVDATAEHGYQLATAALLVEMSKADSQVKEEERVAITNAVRRAFSLSPEETDELMELAEQEADKATSLYQFTRLINETFSPQQKAHVVELLWQVAFADGEVDKYEEHLVRKIADLIYVPHRVFIQAKHRVQGERR
jgi:uncharacterized tellurite resistance protein B-like protein